MKKSWISVIASFILPGAGHLYLGRIKKGSLLLVSYLLSVVLTAFLIGFIPLIGIWIYSMLDSYKLTSVVNKEFNSTYQEN